MADCVPLFSGASRQSLTSSSPPMSSCSCQCKTGLQNTPLSRPHKSLFLGASFHLGALPRSKQRTSSFTPPIHATHTPVRPAAIAFEGASSGLREADGAQDVFALNGHVPEPESTPLTGLRPEDTLPPKSGVVLKQEVGQGVSKVIDEREASRAWEHARLQERRAWMIASEDAWRFEKAVIEANVEAIRQEVEMLRELVRQLEVEAVSMQQALRSTPVKQATQKVTEKVTSINQKDGLLESAIASAPAPAHASRKTINLAALTYPGPLPNSKRRTVLEPSQLPPQSLGTTNQDLQRVGSVLQVAPLQLGRAYRSGGGWSVARAMATVFSVGLLGLAVAALGTSFGRQKFSNFVRREGVYTVVQQQVVEPEWKIQASQGLVIELNSENFADALSARPTFVKFYAPWCHYCKLLAPTWEELAATLHEEGISIQVAQLDAEEHMQLAMDFNLPGFPTLLLFDGTRPLLSHQGPRDLQTLLGFVKRHVRFQ